MLIKLLNTCNLYVRKEYICSITNLFYTMKKLLSSAAIIAATILAGNASAQINGTYIPGSYQPKFSYAGGNYNALPVIRTNPNNASGIPQDSDVSTEPGSVNFVSLGVDASGFGGSVLLVADRPFANGPGIDLFISETSYGSPSCSNYPERADVWVAQVVCDEATSNPLTEPSNWFLLGQVCATDGALDFDASDASCLSWAKYVYIQDRTIPSEYPANNGDGFDVDGINAYHEVPEGTITEGTVTASSVVFYDEGKRKNGTDIPTGPGVGRRDDPSRALGLPVQGLVVGTSADPINNFVALGFKPAGSSEGGSLIVELSRPIFNQNGGDADLIIFETSYNQVNRTCSSYPEHARVYGSCSPQGPWTELVAVQSNLGGNAGQRINGASNGGLTAGSSNICKDGKLDLGNLQSARYIKVVDNSNRNQFNNTADAYDIDAIVGLGQCGTPDFKVEHILSMIANDAVEISIFPNPAVDRVSFNIATSDVNENVTIEIVDNLGRKMISEVVNVASNSVVVNDINISNLTAGIYMVVINTSTGREVQKLIKN